MASSLPGWTSEQASELQLATNRIFKTDERLRACEFSISIADPNLKDCPFVGCSTGFTKMTGYEMEEVLGRNCRFLVDPVPAEYVNEVARTNARDYVQSVMKRINGSASSAVSRSENKTPDWVPNVTRTSGWVWCAQVNARKDGTLFHNMFHLKEFTLEENRTYIIGLQAELPGDPKSMVPDDDMYREACFKLDQRWIEVEKILMRHFWFSAPIRRQEHDDVDDGFCSDDGAGLSDCDTDCPENIADYTYVSPENTAR
jgi:hypothetical protein